MDDLRSRILNSHLLITKYKDKEADLKLTHSELDDLRK
jgi:hypothetical protein